MFGFFRHKTEESSPKQKPGEYSPKSSLKSVSGKSDAMSVSDAGEVSQESIVDRQLGKLTSGLFALKDAILGPEIAAVLVQSFASSPLLQSLVSKINANDAKVTDPIDKEGKKEEKSTETKIAELLQSLVLRINTLDIGLTDLMDKGSESKYDLPRTIQRVQAFHADILNISQELGGKLKTLELDKAHKKALSTELQTLNTALSDLQDAFKLDQPNRTFKETIIDSTDVAEVDDPKKELVGRLESLLAAIPFQAEFNPVKRKVNSALAEVDGLDGDNIDDVLSHAEKFAGLRGEVYQDMLDIFEKRLKNASSKNKSYDHCAAQIKKLRQEVSEGSYPSFNQKTGSLELYQFVDTLLKLSPLDPKEKAAASLKLPEPTKTVTAAEQDAARSYSSPRRSR